MQTSLFRGSSPPMVKRWNRGRSGERMWMNDSGWGCMLRTGQSLLANTLLYLHLGRGMSSEFHRSFFCLHAVLSPEWHRPPYRTADYAKYVHILTWFLDTPSSHAPFSVHHMVLTGKEPLSLVISFSPLSSTSPISSRHHIPLRRYPLFGKRTTPRVQVGQGGVTFAHASQ